MVEDITKDEINKIIGHGGWRVREHDEYIVICEHWDDLDAEPERTQRVNRLKEYKRLLVKEGYECSDIEEYHGKAHFKVEGYN